MTIYFYLLGLAIILQNAIRFWAYTSCFKLKIRTSIGYTIYLSITTAITFVSLYYQAVNNSSLPFIFLFVLLFYFFPFHFLTQGDIRKKLILHVIDQFVIDTLIEFILYTVVNLIYKHEVLLCVFDYERFMCGAAFCLLAAPIKYMMVKIWNKINKTDNEKLNPLFMIFPTGQIIVFAMIQIERYYSGGLWGIDNLLIISIGNL